MVVSLTIYSTCTASPSIWWRLLMLHRLCYLVRQPVMRMPRVSTSYERARILTEWVKKLTNGAPRVSESRSFCLPCSCTLPCPSMASFSKTPLVCSRSLFFCSLCLLALLRLPVAQSVEHQTTCHTRLSTRARTCMVSVNAFTMLSGVMSDTPTCFMRWVRSRTPRAP